MGDAAARLSSECDGTWDRNSAGPEDRGATRLALGGWLLRPLPPCGDARGRGETVRGRSPDDGAYFAGGGQSARRGAPFHALALARRRHVRRGIGGAVAIVSVCVY